MKAIAKVAIQSSLPQLDRVFDYRIPSSLIADIKVGSKVKVPFGKSKKPLDAFVIEIAERSEFPGALSEILEVVASFPLLTPSIFELLHQLSDRAACSLGDILKLAVPSHMPRVYEKFLQNNESLFDSPSATVQQNNLDSNPSRGNIFFELAEPRVRLDSTTGSFAPTWASRFVQIAAENLAKGNSTLILVPDYREHEVVLSLLSKAIGNDLVIDYSQELPKSKQYEAFLKCFLLPKAVVVGSRAAVFAPLNNLASVLMFDEGDRSYQDVASPYLGARDVVLIRQSIESFELGFSSHSVSTEMQRLIATKYVQVTSLDFPLPKVSHSEPGLRLDSHAYLALKSGLESGAALVQVASLGDSSAIYCKNCGKSAGCAMCAGPLWKDSNGVLKCRWCNAFAFDQKCSCGSAEFRSGRAGSTRTAAELGRMFPAVRVVESTGDKKLVSLPSGKVLVVATAGAEPYIEGGYSVVVILDSQVALARQNLKAKEEAVNSWANAIAKCSASGAAIIAGLDGDFAKQISLWNMHKIAEQELLARTELYLSPVSRMGSLTGTKTLVESMTDFLVDYEKIVRIGPAPMPDSDEWRLIFKYPHSEASELGRTIKAQVARITAGKTRQLESGRSTRALTVKMNDPEVV